MVRLAALGLLLVALLGSSWYAGDASADGHSGMHLEGLPPKEPSPGQRTLVLSARLTDNDSPVAGMPITFYIITNIFGERLMKVGDSVSDATGMASVLYQPRWEGEHTAVVRFDGAGDYAATQATFHFEAAEAESPYEPARFGIDPIREWLPVGVGVMVLAVWASLMFALLTTVMGIRSASAGAGAAVMRPLEPWDSQVHHPAPLGKILLALVVLMVAIAVPASWLVNRAREPEEASLATPNAQFHGDGAGGEFDPTQPITLPDPVPLPATLTSYIQTVTYDASGQPAPGSIALPADVAVNGTRIRILDGERGRIATVTSEGTLTFILEAGRTGEVSIKNSQAMDASGEHLYVAAPTGEVVVVSVSGSIDDVIRPVIPEGEEPIATAGIALTESGDIWLSDSANHRVILLNPSGEYRRVIGEGARSSKPEGFNEPRGIGLDIYENLYVADSLNRVIKKFSPFGVLLQTIGAGRLDTPTGVAVNEQGLIFVADEAAHMVSVFAPNGGYVGSISDARFGAPHSVKVEGDDLYVADKLAGVFVFEPLVTESESP